MKLYNYIYMDVYKYNKGVDKHIKKYEISKENWKRLNDIYDMRQDIKKYNI